MAHLTQVQSLLAVGVKVILHAVARGLGTVVRKSIKRPLWSPSTSPSHGNPCSGTSSYTSSRKERASLEKLSQLPFRIVAVVSPIFPTHALPVPKDSLQASPVLFPALPHGIDVIPHRQNKTARLHFRSPFSSSNGKKLFSLNASALSINSKSSPLSLTLFPPRSYRRSRCPPWAPSPTRRRALP